MRHHFQPSDDRVAGKPRCAYCGMIQRGPGSIHDTGDGDPLGDTPSGR